MTTSPVIQVVGILGGIRIVRRTTWGTGLLVWGSLVFSVAESFLGLLRSFEGCRLRLRQTEVRRLTEVRGPLELFWESLDSAPLSFIFLFR